MLLAIYDLLFIHSITPTDLYGELPSYHHGGCLEGVVTQPQLPDDAPVVAVVFRVGEVLSVQVCLETAEMSCKQSGQDRVDNNNLPVEPPAATISRSTWATFWRLFHCVNLI